MSGRACLAYGQSMAKTPKRRRRTAAEWKQLIQAWEASGLGAERYSRGRDFSGSSLYVWRNRLRSEGLLAGSEPERSVNFVPVVLEDDAEADPGDRTQWQLETSTGLALRMSGPDAVRGLEVALRWLDGRRRG